MTLAKVEEWFAGVDCDLPNGVRLWACQIERCDRYYIALGVPVGGECDPEGQEGIAHFLEHVAFRGGKRFPSSLHLKDHLTAWGGFPKGVTSRQFTYYDLSLPPELLLRGLDVLPALLFDIGFHGVEQERSIIQQEIHNRLNQLDKVVYDAVAAALTDHAKWQPLVCGTPDSLAAISVDDLRRFHEHWYNSGNVYGVIIGPRDEELLLGALVKAVEGIPRKETREHELPKPPTISPGSARRCWKEWGANFDTAVLAYGVQLPQDSQMKRAATLVSKLLDDGSGSPLFQALREETGLVYDFDMRVESYRGFDRLCFKTSAQPSRIPQLMRAFEQCVQDERHYTSFLFAVAKQRLMHDIRDRPGLNELGRTKLETMLERRDSPRLNDDLEGLNKLGRDELVDFVRHFLRPEQWRVVHIVPNE